MDINSLVSSALDYIQANVEGSIAVAVIVLLLLIKKPTYLLVLIGIAAVAYVVMLIFEKISATGLG